MNIISQFSDYIRNIAIFIIFAGLVGIIMPNAKYKEYISLTLGFVLMFIVLGPLLDIIGSFSSPIDNIINGLTNGINTDVISKEYSSYSESQQELVLNEFAQQINGQIMQSVNTYGGAYGYVSSSVELDLSDGEFGGITSISLIVEEKTAEPTSQPFIRIEPVTVDSVSVFSPVKESASDDFDDETKSLKKLISDFYNLPDSNIHITVLK